MTIKTCFRFRLHLKQLYCPSGISRCLFKHLEKPSGQYYRLWMAKAVNICLYYQIKIRSKYDLDLLTAILVYSVCSGKMSRDIFKYL